MRYVAELKAAIKDVHGCEAVYVESFPVTETFKDKVVWKGQVSVFDLVGHPKAKRCYAWGAPEEDGELNVTAVLEVPPISSPLLAVQASLVAAARARRSES